LLEHLVTKYSPNDIDNKLSIVEKSVDTNKVAISKFGIKHFNEQYFAKSLFIVTVFISFLFLIIYEDKDIILLSISILISSYYITTSLNKKYTKNE
jgi:hypothetical protein